MAFSSSRLAIKQVTFEAEDERYKEQTVSSLNDLVSFDCEFPQQESFSLKKSHKKREKCRPETDNNSKNFDEAILNDKTIIFDLSGSKQDQSQLNKKNKEEKIEILLKKMNASPNIDKSNTKSVQLSKKIDPSIDLNNVLRHAEELLKNFKPEELSPKSTISSINSRFQQNKEATQYNTKISKNINTFSRSNSRSSLNTNDENTEKIESPYFNTRYINSEIGSLREENELLVIKINKLKYESRSKDQVIDDLKQKIAQMHIDLESVKINKTQFQTEFESLRINLKHLNDEKSEMYQKIKELLNENEQLNEKNQLAQKKLNAHISDINRLREENDTLNKASIDIKMRCLKEKEDLVKNLEQIEKDIIKKEELSFMQKYEKILTENCEKLRKEESEKYRKMLENETEKLKSIYEKEWLNFSEKLQKENLEKEKNSNSSDIEYKFKMKEAEFANEKYNLGTHIKKWKYRFKIWKENLKKKA